MPPIILEGNRLSSRSEPSVFVTIDSMPRHRKSKSPANIPAPIPTSPAELVQRSISQRDSRALAASSTAIVLPFGSPFYGTRDTSSDGAIVRGRNTGWQMAYGAARMAIEMAKESSDMFLPLKAVVGAMSVLIKNYDVSAFYPRAEYLLILYPFLAPANIG
jgi:hypothetical protein